MELQRALSDLAEVRDRLAQLQRFEGYSAPAAAASGVVAIVASLAQRMLAPMPLTPEAQHTYLLIWFSCLAVALLLNYGAVTAWLIKHRAPGARSRFRTAAISIAPSILLGGALSIALIDHGAYSLLPGTWFAFYAIGLFASRGSIPTFDDRRHGILRAACARVFDYAARPCRAGVVGDALGIWSRATRHRILHLGGPPAVSEPQAAPFAYPRLERIFHERGRLAICTCLIAHPNGLSFTELQSACDLTDGNLNRHLHALAEVGIVATDKQRGMGRALSTYRITKRGRQRFLAYVDELESVVRDVHERRDSVPRSKLATT